MLLLHNNLSPLVALIASLLITTTHSSFDMPFYFSFPGASNTPNEDNFLAAKAMSLQVKMDDVNDEQCFLNSNEHTPQVIAAETFKKWEEVGIFNLSNNEESNKQRRWLTNSIEDTIVSRQSSRRDACFDKDDIWNSINLEGLNEFDVTKDVTNRRTRVGNSPMLRSLRSQFDFPAQLASMGLNKYWAELGVLQGNFSRHLLQVRL